jgi:hypothetical protein
MVQLQRAASFHSHQSEKRSIMQRFEVSPCNLICMLSFRYLFP